jgi:hypothetical protein
VGVLLRQPHGFEGLGEVPEVLDCKDHAVAHGVDSGSLKCEIGAMSCATPDELGYDSVTRVDEVGNRLSLGGVPGLAGARGG